MQAMEEHWRKLSEEVMSGMKEWRDQHPNATLSELEEAIDERLNRLRARMLEDAALASPKADWSQTPEEQRPACPQCGKPLAARGKKKRRLQTTGGQQITLERSYGTCPSCGSGFFPPR